MFATYPHFWKSYAYVEDRPGSLPKLVQDATLKALFRVPAEEKRVRSSSAATLPHTHQHKPGSTTQGQAASPPAGSAQSVRGQIGAARRG